MRQLRARLAEGRHGRQPEEVARDAVELGHVPLHLAPGVVLSPRRDVDQRQGRPPSGKHGVLLHELLDRIDELVQPALRHPDHEQLGGEDALRVGRLHPAAHRGRLGGELLGLVKAALHLGERRRPAHREVGEEGLMNLGRYLLELLVAGPGLVDARGLDEVEDPVPQTHHGAVAVMRPPGDLDHLRAHSQPVGESERPWSSSAPSARLSPESSVLSVAAGRAGRSRARARPSARRASPSGGG